MATQIASLYAVIGAKVQEFTAGMNQVSSGLKNAGAAMAKTGGIMSATVTAPLAMIGKKAIDVAASFESQMNIMAVAAGQSADGLETLRNAAIRVGADTELVGIDSAQAAEAMTNFYKAGLDTAQIMGDLDGYLAGNTSLTGALRAAIDMAAASELNLASASDVVSIAMATFGIDAGRATEITDNFVKAADASVTSVPELADAMKNLGPSFASIYASTGDSVQVLGDMNTALAILSQRGISGAEAGTALKSMITNMMRPTDEVQEALSALNVQLYNADGSMRRLPDVMADFSAALTVGATKTVQVSKLTGAQTEEYERLSKKLASVKQRLADYASGISGAGQSEKSRANAIAKLEAQQAAIEGQLAPLAELANEYTTATTSLTEAQRNQYITAIAGTYGMKAMNTLLAEGADGWASMEVAIGEAADTQSSAAARTKGFGAAMEALQGTIETLMITAITPLMQNSITPLIQRITEFISKIIELDPKLLTLGVTILGIVAAAGPVLLALGGVVSVLGMLVSPIGLIVAGIAALGVAFVKSQGGILPTIERLRAFGTDLAARVAPAIEWVRGAVATMAGVWTGTLLPALQSAWSFVQSNIVPLFQAVLGAALANTSGQVNVLASVWGNILKPALDALWPVLQQIGAWLAAEAPGAIQATTGFITNDLTPAITAFWTFVADSLIPTLVTMATTLVATVGNAVQTLTAIWQNTFLPVLQAVGNFLVGTLFPALASLGNLLSAVVGVAVTALAGLWQNVLQPALQTAWDWLANKLSPIFAAISAFIADTFSPAVGGLTDKVGGGLSPALETLQNLLDKAKGGFNAIGGAIQKVTGLFNSLADKVRNFKLPDVLTPGSPTPFETGLRGIAEALTDVAAGFFEFTKKISPKQADVFEDMANGIEDFAQAITHLSTIKAGGGAIDITGILDQFEAASVQMMDRLQHIQNLFGAKKIKELVKSGQRLKDAIGFLFMEWDAIKAFEVPDLDVFFANISDVIVRAINALMAIGNEFGDRTIERASEIGQSMTAVLGMIEPGIKAMEALAEYVAQSGIGEKAKVFTDDLVAVAQQMAASLGALTQDWIQAELFAAQVAPQVQAVVGLLGTGLDFELPESETWAADLPKYAKMLVSAADVVRLEFEQLPALWKEAELFAAKAAGNVKNVLGVLGTGLDFKLPESDNWAFDIITFAQNLVYAADLLRLEIERLPDIWGDAEMFAAKAGDNLSKVIGVLSAGLDFKLPESDNWAFDVIRFAQNAVYAADLVRLEIERLPDIWAENEMFAAKAADNISAVLGILGTKLALEMPQKGFLKSIDAFIDNVVLAAEKLLDGIDRIMAGPLGGSLEAAGKAAEQIGKVMDLLNIGKVFADLQKAGGHNAVGLANMVMSSIQGVLNILVPKMEELQGQYQSRLTALEPFIPMATERIQNILNWAKGMQGLDTTHLNTNTITTRIRSVLDMFNAALVEVNASTLGAGALAFPGATAAGAMAGGERDVVGAGGGVTLQLTINGDLIAQNPDELLQRISDEVSNLLSGWETEHMAAGNAGAGI